MSETRKLMKRFASYVEAHDFISAFSLVNDDGTYTVIGSTPISTTYFGREDLTERIMKVMGDKFIVPPSLTFSHFIVDGNQGFLRAAGDGSARGPGNRPYDQPYYAWYMRTENGGFAEIIEYLDTMAIETQLFEKELT